MPDFICLTVLLLANNEAIVCSGYVATQSVTGGPDIVIKQALTYYNNMTLIYHQATSLSFQCNFCHPIKTMHIEMFDATPGFGQRGQCDGIKSHRMATEVFFPAVIFYYLIKHCSECVDNVWCTNYLYPIINYLHAQIIQLNK